MDKNTIKTLNNFFISETLGKGQLRIKINHVSFENAIHFTLNTENLNREDSENVKKFLKLHFIKNNFLKEPLLEKQAEKLEQKSLFSRVCGLKDELTESRSDNSKLTKQLKFYKNKFNELIEFNDTLQIANKFLLIEELKDLHKLNNLIPQISFMKEDEVKKSIRNIFLDYPIFEVIFYV